VEKARENGQLLVYTPSNRPLDLPGDTNAPEGNHHDHELLKEPFCDPSRTDPVEVGRNPTDSVSTNGPSVNEEMTLMLKQLLEQVQQSDGRHVTREQLLELQTANNSKFEQQNERLQAELKQVFEQWRSDKEDFLVKRTRLEFELESARQQIQELPRLEQQLLNLHSDKSQMLAQIRSMEEKLAVAAAELQDYKSQLSALRKHNEAEVKQLVQTNLQLQQNQVDLTGELQQMTVSREELAKKVDEYERVIAQQEVTIQELREQLDRASVLLSSKEETLASIQQASTGHESLIVELKEEIERLARACSDLQASFTSHQHESQQNLDDLTSQLEEKNATIGHLFRQLGDKQNELLSSTKDWNRAKEAAARVEEKLQCQVGELNAALEDAVRQLEEYDAVKLDLQQRLQLAQDHFERESQANDEQRQQLTVELDEARDDLRRAQLDRDEAHRRLQEQANDTTDASSQLQSAQQSYNELEERYKEKEKAQSMKIAELDHQNRQLKLHVKETERERDEARQNMLGFSDREAELYRKLQESDRIRRELHSKVMQLTGNIRVYVRVRPHLPGEGSYSEPALGGGNDSKKRSRPEDNCPFLFPGVYDRETKAGRSVGSDDATKNVIVATEPLKDRGGLSDRRKTWKFGFDNVFSPNHGQDDVWEATMPLVQSAVDGYNVTIFAYGQTGSGKTYTMLGDERNPGIVGRAVQKLFQAKQEIESLSRGDAAVQVSVELLEIYNEKVSDLLDPDSPVNRNQHSLKVVSKEVVGNVVVNTKSVSEVMELVALAQDRRCVKATASNSESSRSHMLFTINFVMAAKDGSTRKGKLNICDLAGSERLSKSGTHIVGVCIG
jgi:chromosome segregation ATPase